MHTNRHVEITVRGHLSARLATAFEGMNLVSSDGASRLVGHVADQAQLHGLLARVRDLGLELESVTMAEIPPPAGQPGGTA